MTKEEFIRRAILVHGDKYDYSKVEDIKTVHDYVTIICPEHGEFQQKAYLHYGNGRRGRGCIRCAGLKKLTTEEFIEKAKVVHGDKYDYSKVNYVNSVTPVTIICPVHGEFQQPPSNHVGNKTECPKCKGGAKYTQEEFIEKAIKKFEGKFDYSKVNYVNSSTPVTIICPVHGEFQQKPVNHLNGSCGCRACSGSIKHTTESFIKKSKEVHGDKYDYSKSKYVSAHSKITVTCKKHGDFLIRAENHMLGKGCQRCSSSSLENTIKEFLIENNIESFDQYTWDWLTYKRKQKVDFYLPKYNIVIECQGLQHFESIPRFDKYETLETRQKKDKNKLDKCREHNITILYYSNLSTSSKKYNYPYQVFEDLDELLKEIKKYGPSD